VDLWVECADVSVKKVYRILNRYSDVPVVIMKISDNEARNFFRIFSTSGDLSPYLSVIGFQEGFIDSICEGLRDRVLISAVCENETLYLSWDDVNVKSRIFVYGSSWTV